MDKLMALDALRDELTQQFRQEQHRLERRLDEEQRQREVNWRLERLAEYQGLERQ